LNDTHIAYVEFISAGSAFVGAHFADHDHAGFVGKVLQRIKYFWRYLIFGHNTLNHARAVAKNGEDELAALTLVVEPAANSNGLAVMPANLRDCSDGGFG